MATLQGKNLMLAIGGKVYGYATACTLDIAIDTTETASTSWKQMSAEGGESWKSYEISKKSWTVSTDNMTNTNLEGFDDLFSAITDATVNGKVAIKFGVIDYTSVKDTDKDGNLDVDDAFTLTYVGEAVVTSISLTGSTEGEATYSVSLQGTGALTKSSK
jgi:predicted secreted protein